MRDASQGYHARHQRRDALGRWETTDPRCYWIGLRLTPRQLAQLAAIDGHAAATLTDAVLALVDMLGRAIDAETGDGPQEATDAGTRGNTGLSTRTATQGAQPRYGARTVTIRCTRGEYDQIRALCARLGCSPSVCIARALAEIDTVSTR